MAIQAVELFHQLSAQRVRYMVCGGLAIKLHGINRRTADIDLLLDLDADNVATFERVVASFDYLPFLPVPLQSFTEETFRFNMIHERNLVAYSFYNCREQMLHLDVMMDYPFTFEQAWKQCTYFLMKGFSVPLVPIALLISMKEYAAREQDELDISELRKLLRT